MCNYKDVVSVFPYLFLICISMQVCGTPVHSEDSDILTHNVSIDARGGQMPTISIGNGRQIEGRGISSFFQSFFNYFGVGFNVLMGTHKKKLEHYKEGEEKESPNKITYKNYQLLRIFPTRKRHVNLLEELRDDSEGLQFWTQPMRHHSTDILVPPNKFMWVKKFLTKGRMEYEIVIKDLQKAIKNQNPKVSPLQMELKTAKGVDMTFRKYHRYSGILKFMDALAAKHPNMVEVMTIGKSSQGRPLKAVKISTGLQKTGESKPVVWIDGGMHAREWISPAVVMYIMRQLVENFKSNKKIVEGADWYLLPVANPDGYEYSHTTDRLWRKTRSRSNDEFRRGRFFWETCEGVDANRNWGFHWGERGASDDPCDETYAGPKAFSEPETRAISEFIMDRKDRVKLFLTLHAYSQMWLMPWGFTTKKVGDYDDMMAMGKKAVEAIKRVGGTQYEVGPSTSLLYPTSGASDDWAKGVAGIKYAYTVELRDKGSYGFMLPSSQIIPTGKETFAAIRTLAKAIVCKT